MRSPPPITSAPPMPASAGSSPCRGCSTPARTRRWPTRSTACGVSARTWRWTGRFRHRHTQRMPFTVVFSNGEPRDYGVFDKYEVTDAGVLVIDMHREDVHRHYVAPGGWL